MAPTLRSVATNTGTGTSFTVTTSSVGGLAAVAGDILVAFHCNNFYALSNMSAPTGGPGGWAEITTAAADAGTNLAHIKVWWTTVVSGGAQTITFAETGTADEEKAGVVCVIGTADTSAPADATQPTTGTAVQAQVATGLTAVGADDLLLGVWCSGGGADGGAYTLSGGSLAEQTEFGIVGALSGVIGAETLSASGATGTRTATATNSVAWGATLVAIKAGSGTVPPAPLQPSKVSDRGTVADATAATTSVLTVTSPTSIAVNNYLIARVAVDNSGTSGAAPGCTITDTRNTWTVLGPALADPGAAAAGATAYLCYAKVVTAYQAADTITFNWGGISTTAKAIVLEEWANIHRVTPVAVSATTNDSGAAASTTAVTISRTATTPNQLVYAMLATEGIAGDTVGADSDTTNGTWTTLTTTASANATATNNQRVSGQYKLVTAAGAQSWDSTITSRDWAAIAVVFAVDEIPLRVFVHPSQAATRGGSW